MENITCHALSHSPCTKDHQVDSISRNELLVFSNVELDIVESLCSDSQGPFYSNVNESGGGGGGFLSPYGSQDSPRDGSKA